MEIWDYLFEDFDKDALEGSNLPGLHFSTATLRIIVCELIIWDGEQYE
jgi:hypothetical protein